MKLTITTINKSVQQISNITSQNYIKNSETIFLEML